MCYAEFLFPFAKFEWMFIDNTRKGTRPTSSKKVSTWSSGCVDRSPNSRFLRGSSRLTGSARFLRKKSDFSFDVEPLVMFDSGTAGWPLELSGKCVTPRMPGPLWFKIPRVTYWSWTDPIPFLRISENRTCKRSNKRETRTKILL